MNIQIKLFEHTITNFWFLSLLELVSAVSMLSVSNVL